MPKLNKFKMLIDDGIIKTTGTLFTKHNNELFYAKFDGEEEIYTAVCNENNVLVKGVDKYTSLSGWAVAMIKTHNDARAAISGIKGVNYSDNEEYYDSISIDEIFNAAYEKVVMSSSL